MKKVLPVSLVLSAAIVFVVFMAAGGSATGSGERGHVLEKIAKGEIKPATIPVQTANGTATDKQLPFVSEGTLLAAKAAVLGGDDRGEAADAGSGGDIGLDGANGAGGTTTGAGPAHSLGCGGRTSNGNKRVNQDCTFRRQAEEEIAFNPADPNNVTAGQNDSRIGFNHCGIDFSTNNGKNFGDMQPPFWQKINNPPGEAPTPNDPNSHSIDPTAPGTFHTYDFASDPTNAFDSQGRAFFSCVAPDIFDDANALLVVQSPVGAEGSFYRNIGTFSRSFVVAEDNSPAAFHDKEFIIADTFAGSPNKDNVYVTWTVFNFTCGTGGGFCEAPIYGSMSTNHGVTWSTPEVISGRNASFCQFGGFFTGNPGDNDKCNFDQGSDSVVLPNGDLEVVFINANTPTVNNQQLAVHCHPTGDSEAGTAHLNCGPPTFVAPDVLVGAPTCSFGRFCIPGAFIRTNDYPRIAVNTDNGHLYVVWQDYRNQEWDIQMAHS
jgi:hypothetical protein